MNWNTQLFLAVNDFAGATPWLHDPMQLAFPSDHATMAGAVTVGPFLVNRRLSVVSALAAALMAFSRVYIAAHFAGDVIAALALAAAVSLVGWYLLRRILITLEERACNSRLRPLVTDAGRS